MTVATTDNPTDEKVKVGSESDSKKFDFNTCTKEELVERVKLWEQGKDPKGRDAFCLLNEKDPVAYERVDKMLIGESKSEEPPKAQLPAEEVEKPSESKTEEGTENDDDFIEIPSLKLRKDQLGTFLKNRSPQEALLLKLDAHDHAERTIVDLKERNNGLSSQTLKLREMLIESKKHPPKAEVKEEIKVDEFDFDRNEVDLYDPDQQEKLLTNYEKLLQKLKKGEPPAELKQEVKTKEISSDEKELVTQLENTSLQREFDEINDLQRAAPELRFSDGSTFQQKDRQLLEFRQKVANIVGVTDYVKAHEQFLSNPQVRQLCEARGIVEPPELDKWGAIVKVRSTRNNNINNYAHQIGKKAIEIPNFVGNTYLDIYNRTAPKAGFDKVKLNDQIRSHEEAERKKDAHEARYVTEPPPNASHASNAELGQMNENDILNIVNRYGSKGIGSISSDEAKMLIRLNEIQGIDTPLDLMQKAKG